LPEVALLAIVELLCKKKHKQSVAQSS